LEYQYWWTPSVARTVPLGLATQRAWLRASAAVCAFAFTLAIVAVNEHAPMGIEPGLVARLLVAVVPLAAAAVAALAIMRPWPAFLTVLLLTPVWDAAQVAWVVGPVQVISQTIFLVVLWAGFALSSRADRQAWGRAAPSGLPIPRLAAWAVVALVILAILSTLASPGMAASVTVLEHGILEPLAMAALLVALGVTRRRLAMLLIVLGLSVALGSLLNVAQSVPAAGSLAALQTQRQLFTRLTYFTAGLFGGMLAMAVPLLLGALAARRHLRLSRPAAVVLVAAVAACLAGLFLTFSKSGWLATSAAMLAFLLLLAQSWRRRAAIVLGAAMLSTLVVPWPALVLQVAPAANNAYRSVMVGLMGRPRFDSWNPATPWGHGSVTERFLSSVAGVRMALDHPLLGVGLDQFRTEIPQYKLPQAQATLASAHDFWPEIAAELGLPALAAVVLLFSLAGLGLWRTYRAPPDEQTRILAAALLASLVAWLIVATTFDPDLYRVWRHMASDMLMVVLVTTAALALPQISRRAVFVTGCEEEAEAQKPSRVRTWRIRRAALPRWEMPFFASADHRPRVRPPGGSPAGSKIGS
jgi:O-antigen ligase